MKNREKTSITRDDEQAPSHYQQILFDDNTLNSDPLDSKNKVPADGKQIRFNNSDYQPVDDSSQLTFAEPELNTAVEPNATRKKPAWLWRIALTLFIVIIGIESVDFFISGFNNSPILTSLYGIITACLLLLCSSALLSEWSTLRQFKRRQKIKQQAQQILQPQNAQEDKPSSQAVNVESFCRKISDNLPCDLVAEQEQLWQAALQGEHSADELLQLYSRLVLTKVDEKALREVAKFSTESVVLIALSPVALIDMLIMLWRNVRMINKIAGLYGLKLGYWSRIKLIRQVFVNMVYAGASELIADFGTDMLGADLLGKLSGRLAQGLGAGMLTARLGVKTMQLCRPIAFDDKPKLSQVRKEILTTVKGLLSKS